MVEIGKGVPCYAGTGAFSLHRYKFGGRSCRVDDRAQPPLAGCVNLYGMGCGSQGVIATCSSFGIRILPCRDIPPCLSDYKLIHQGFNVDVAFHRTGSDPESDYLNSKLPRRFVNIHIFGPGLYSAPAAYSGLGKPCTSSHLRHPTPIGDLRSPPSAVFPHALSALGCFARDRHDQDSICHQYEEQSGIAISISLMSA